MRIWAVLLQPICTVQKVRHCRSISPVILGLSCVMVGPDHMAFGFSYFSMGLAFKNRHISRKIQQVVKFTKAEDCDHF